MIIGIVVIVLIGVRVALPFVIKHFVNKSLNDMDGYSGYVHDIDLRLFRGAYVIDSVTVKKTDGDVPVPFVNIDKIDLSVQWDALFKGSVVGEIVMKNPRVNFVASGEDEDKKQYGQEVSWVEQVKELMPLRINRFEIINGEIAFKDYSTEPVMDIRLGSLNFIATNLSNASDEQDTLPSSLDADAQTMGGDITLKGEMNALKETPDFDFNLEFENVDLTQLNNFTESYADFDFETGQLNFYFEMAMLDGRYEGYAKPLFNDVKVAGGAKEEDKSIFRKAWESVVGTTFEILENQPKDQTATQIPFKGTIEDSNIKTWKTIKNVFTNAFVRAFERELDYQISLENVSGNSADN